MKKVMYAFASSQDVKDILYTVSSADLNDVLADLEKALEEIPYYEKLDEFYSALSDVRSVCLVLRRLGLMTWDYFRSFDSRVNDCVSRRLRDICDIN